VDFFGAQEQKKAKDKASLLASWIFLAHKNRKKLKIRRHYLHPDAGDKDAK
jgi:hypothetical protein